MIERNNKTCIVCGKSYKYCGGCAEYAHLEPWHSIYCSNNCKDIFNAVSMYNKVSNEETKEKLNKCDLSNKDNFHKNILKTINELYSSVEKTEIVEAVELHADVEKVLEIVEPAESIHEKIVEVVETIEIKEEVENTIKEKAAVKATSKNRKKKKDYEVI